MAAAAVKTSRIRLGTGVLIPSNRIAPVAANGFASLNALAPGRIDSASAPVYRPPRHGPGCHEAGHMEEYVRVVLALLEEETAENCGRGPSAAVRFLNPELGLINTRDRGCTSPPTGESRALSPVGCRLAEFYRRSEFGHCRVGDMQAAWETAGGHGRPIGHRL